MSAIERLGIKDIKEVPMKQNANDVKVALLEQSIGHVNETLIRLEKKFDHIDKKFESVEKRFDDIDMKLDKKFDEIDKKLDRFDSRVWTNFYWTLGTMFALVTFCTTLMAKGFGWFH